MCDNLTLCKRLRSVEYKCDVDLKTYCTFGIGGKAKLMIFPKTISELVHAVFVTGGQSVVVGNASNILFSDKNFDKPIITTRHIKEELCVNGNIVCVNAGCGLNHFLLQCAKLGLGGLEKLYGIPATIGGALFMNAGAFGQTISDALLSVKVLYNGKIKVVNKSNLVFDYRKTSFMLDNMIILEASFLLKRQTKEEIEQNIKQTILWRAEHQPSGKSAGSIFKKSQMPAGYLIEKSGFKGRTVGGATVSERHANFIINNGKASANDVMQLIQEIKQKVYLDHGVLLEEEIIYMGENNDTNRRFSYTF